MKLRCCLTRSQGRRFLAVRKKPKSSRSSLEKMKRTLSSLNTFQMVTCFENGSLLRDKEALSSLLSTSVNLLCLVEKVQDKQCLSMYAISNGKCIPKMKPDSIVEVLRDCKSVKRDRAPMAATSLRRLIAPRTRSNLHAGGDAFEMNPRKDRK